MSKVATIKRSMPDSVFGPLMRDAVRFRYLQSLPVVEAQAYFWNYKSKSQRAKAIDKAMRGD